MNKLVVGDATRLLCNNNQ